MNNTSTKTTHNSFFALATLKSEELLRLQKSSSKGLSQDEAKRRVLKFGYNELNGRQISSLQIFLRQFKSPFIYLLFGAASLAFLLGEKIDSVLILLFIAINSTLGWYQEYKSEHALQLLKSYVVPKARVVRSDKDALIETREIVPGDIILLQPGDIIPADVCFIEAEGLIVNETILTGESAPVKKIASLLPHAPKTIYEAQNLGFAGTSIQNGEARALAVATGANTSIGQIAKVTTATARTTSFDKTISRFSAFTLRMVLATLTFVFAANLIIKWGTLDISSFLIFSIALAVSVIPEALPLVTMFSLSKGALHLAKNKVVVKRLSSIEDLGSIEILCTDKTGTLTENKMTVHKVFSCFHGEPHEHESLVLTYAALASPPLLEKKAQSSNTFDVAIYERIGNEIKELVKSYERIDETPFDPQLRRNSVVVKKDGIYELIVRGAHEEIIKLAPHLSPPQIEQLNKWIIEEEQQGHRIIAFAKKAVDFEHDRDNSDKERGLEFLGLISFTDPLKPTARAAIARARNLGVQVKILTGDSAAVAGAVGVEIGLIKSCTDVITGEEFERLGNTQMHEAALRYNVFARVDPLQKFRIIQLLREKHEVGFLGEGINDAPALKAANVALVVHDASDIAKDAADIVLLKKSLGVIVSGIEEGRAVFANTIKYIKATLASNFGNFYAVAIASLLIDFLPMLPIQILLVNLLSDFPMIAIATDTVDKEELKKPRVYDMKEIVLLCVILGLVSTVFDFIFFRLFYQMSPTTLQTGWFIGSILTELVFLMSIRTRRFFLKARLPSLAVIIFSGLAFIVTIVLPFTDFGENVLHFERPLLEHVIWILSVVGIYFAVSEGVKMVYYKVRNNGGRAGVKLNSK